MTIVDDWWWPRLEWWATNIAFVHIVDLTFIVDSTLIDGHTYGWTDANCWVGILTENTPTGVCPSLIFCLSVKTNSNRWEIFVFKIYP